jgi:HK97 gp10 family phage protein
VTYRTRAARDDLGNPRKDENGTSLFAAMRDIEYSRGRDRLFDRAAEKKLTSQGRWELKTGRAISFGQSAKAQGEYHSKHNAEDPIGRQRKSDSPEPGSEGQLGGSLRRSIDLRDDSTGDKPKASIVAGGEDAPYARFVEFGTRHAAAQPFLRPALKHVEDPYRTMMREELLGRR